MGLISRHYCICGEVSIGYVTLAIDRLDEHTARVRNSTTGEWLVSFGYCYKHRADVEATAAMFLDTQAPDQA